MIIAAGGPAGSATVTVTSEATYLTCNYPGHPSPAGAPGVGARGRRDLKRSDLVTTEDDLPVLAQDGAGPARHRRAGAIRVRVSLTDSDGGLQVTPAPARSPGPVGPGGQRMILKFRGPARPGPARHGGLQGSDRTVGQPGVGPWQRPGLVTLRKGPGYGPAGVYGQGNYPPNADPFVDVRVTLAIAKPRNIFT